MILSPNRKLAKIVASTVLLMFCISLLAQIPQPSDANSLGPPDRNIEDSNCFCHTNTDTGKERDPDLNMVTVEIPSKMVTNGNESVSVAIDYSPATEDTFYGFSIDLDSADGKSLEGAALKGPQGTPSENNTHLAQSEPMSDPFINFTLTAPSKSQTLRVVIMAIAVDHDGTEMGDHWNLLIKEVEVFKMREVFINASISNNGVVEAKDVNVSFIVDGDEIGIENIPLIPPGETMNVTHPWDATFFAPGQYKVEIVVDSNKTTLELDEGNNRIVKNIDLEPLGGVKEEGPDLQSYLILTLISFIVLTIFWIIYKKFR